MATIKSIEEKAKRYDEAIKRVEDIVGGKCPKPFVFTEGLFDYIFPELKESEDEKIRKGLVQFFEEKDEEDFEEWIPKAKVLAWLEKQGEQKETLCDKCKKTQPSHSCQDITALGRCALEKQGEQKLTEFEKAVKQVMEEAIECGDTHNLKADADMLLSLVHNSAWSEEDESILNEAIYFIRREPYHECDAEPIVDWLKSLKDKILPQPKQEWSEEDEINLERAIWYVENPKQIVIKNSMLVEWLKSLKDRVQPQFTWKPSDEQIKQLGWVAEQNKNNMIGKELMTLYQDLKKLKGNE